MGNGDVSTALSGYNVNGYFTRLSDGARHHVDARE